ncbi:hypothetical protein PM082_014865 [Marasmius tenuissimus]|nr:hypothetical protein PM082_014865 [Marasmius tenuissimus]
MLESTWKYAHGKQILMDGTFGVCSRKILLFVMMGLDEQKKGTPLAFLFFSPPKSQRESSGYDSGILAKLLEKWRGAMEAYRNGQLFLPRVAITDTDLRERIA